MGFDFDGSVRWSRAARRQAAVRRPDSELHFVAEDGLAGSALLLDTCVYIDQLQGRAPELVLSLIAARQVNHSAVAVQELMHTVGVLNPRDPRTPGVVAALGGLIAAMPEHRLFAPDVEVLGRAALLSGILSRLQGYGGDNRMRALFDCTLLLQASKLGLTVLTGNIRDFDILTQLQPRSRVLFYRKQ